MKVSYLIAIAFGFLPCPSATSAAEKEPLLDGSQAAIQQYLRAWTEQNWKGMYDLLDAATRKVITVDQFRDLFALRLPLDPHPHRMHPVSFSIEKGERENEFDVRLTFSYQSLLGNKLVEFISPARRAMMVPKKAIERQEQAILLFSEYWLATSEYVNVRFLVDLLEYAGRLAQNDPLEPALHFLPETQFTMGMPRFFGEVEDLSLDNWPCLGATLPNLFGLFVLIHEGRGWKINNGVKKVATEVIERKLAEERATEEAKRQGVRIAARLLGLL